MGGTVENSAKGMTSITAVFPVMIFVMLTILMIQLQSFQKLILVISVAPLGLIGVVAALLPTGTPLGFVAILGVVALIGMIVRNSVIVIAQIDEHLEAGRASLGRRDQRHDAPRAADPADGGGRQPRHDPDRAGSLLGTRWPTRSSAA